jgi:hypothetical protein
MAIQTDSTRTIEVRCPREQCVCRAGGGKLLATLIDVPRALLGGGAVLQLACPNRKSRLIRIRL